MAIRIEHVGDVAIVIAEGRFVGGEETDELDAALTKLVVEGGQKKTLLNLAGTRLMNSMGLGVLVKTQTAVNERGAHFALCGLQPSLKAVIVRCFRSAIQVHDSCDEALKALQEV